MTFKVTREGELAGRGELVKTCGNSPRSRKFQRKTRLKSGCKKKRRSLSKRRRDLRSIVRDSVEAFRCPPEAHLPRRRTMLPSSQTSAKTTHRLLIQSLWLRSLEDFLKSRIVP